MNYDSTNGNLRLNMIPLRSSVILIAIAILFTACGPDASGATPDVQRTLAANVAGTLTAAAPLPTEQLPTVVVLPTSTEAPSPTAVYNGLPVQVNVLNIIMRSGPSTLFEKITSFPQGTLVTIMGKISNNEWVWIRNPQGGMGWMSYQFLNPVDLAGVPIVNVSDSYSITGNVLDLLGQGVDGINIVVFQGEGSNQVRTDTYSALDGSFIVYLPDTSQGIWNVGTAGIKCTSRVMDAFCKTTGSIITPTYEIALPQTVSLLFNFDPNTP